MGIPSIHRHRYVPMKKIQVHSHVYNELTDLLKE